MLHSCRLNSLSSQQKVIRVFVKLVHVDEGVLFSMYFCLFPSLLSFWGHFQSLEFYCQKYCVLMRERVRQEGIDLCGFGWWSVLRNLQWSIKPDTQSFLLKLTPKPLSCEPVKQLFNLHVDLSYITEYFMLVKDWNSSLSSVELRTFLCWKCLQLWNRNPFIVLLFGIC